jgi:hypothetical protein
MLRDITVLSIINADGEYLQSYSIFAMPKTRQTEFVFYDSIGKIEFSETGWVNTDIKIRFAQWLVSELPKEGLKVIHCDNHSTNFDNDIANIFRENNCVLQTSHPTRPTFFNPWT